MAEDIRPARASLHGYHPVSVDENALSDEERQAATVGAVVQAREWSSHVTPRERHLLEQEIAEINKEAELARRSGVYFTGELPAVVAKRAGLALRGTMRAIAREKYGHIWLGDGPPPWSI